MDIDDDRLLSIDMTDVRRLNAFKVPKKIVNTKSSFDKVSLTSSEFKDNIYSKIINAFKSPNSCSSLKVLSAYNICNVEVESMFNKRKQYFKKEYSPQSSAEYFGFIYISNLSDLKKIVNRGRIKNGNLRESVLGQAEMGVSVCQYSDIFHPGDNKNYPRAGYLLLVKYIRGRVCYVVEDNNPMEPQPNYDCHMSKVYNHESFPSVGRAFHTTQVYLYEYSDDFDLIDEPSHVMPWAAVEFTWGGPLLYKLVHVPIAIVCESQIKDSTSKVVDKRIRLLTRSTGNPSQRIKQSYTDCTPILCTQLQLKFSITKDESSENTVFDIPVTILSYHSHWHSFASLMSSCWPICELIEWMSFEQEFLKPLIKNPLNDNFSLNDVFNKRITLNRNTETKITSLEDPQFVNYLRMVVNDPSRDRAKMARLIDHFHETKTVGRIRLYDAPGTMLFIFPDSTLSQNFGIPSVKTLDVNYLHILLVTDKSLAFNQSSDLIDEFLEIELKTNILKLCDSQSIGVNDPMLPMHILKQSLRNQNHVQKSKLREMCGFVANSPLVFETINFEYVENAIVTASQPIVSPIIIDTKDEVKSSNKETNGNSFEQVVDKEDDDDRPYDPTENLLGLIDISSMKKNNQIRRPEPVTMEPPMKVQKREDEKDDLNKQLLELFSKNSAENEVSTKINDTLLLEQEQFAFTERMSPQPVVFSKLLDRNKFKTQYRIGVSVYEPESVIEQPDDTSHPQDVDLRFPDRNGYQFYYPDSHTTPYNGVHFQ